MKVPELYVQLYKPLMVLVTTACYVESGIKHRFWHAAVSHMLVWTVPIALAAFSITAVFAAINVWHSKTGAQMFLFFNSMLQNIQVFPVFVTFCGGICMAHLRPSVFGRTGSSWSYQVAHSSSPLPCLFGTIITFIYHLHWNLNTWNLSLFHLQFFTQKNWVSTIAPKI